MASELSEQFLIARIGDEERLLALKSVREILPAMELSLPTGLGGACCGVSNLRGEVVPVFDPARRGRAPLVSQLIVVLYTESHANVGLLVDDVLDIIELDERELRSQPSGRGGTCRVAHVNGRALSVLNLDEEIHAA
jgi:chemotaxis signal transduction protein